jgi:hypothetical protein
MSAVIAPKSDQINADDLIAGPITIRISRVETRPGTEQPVSIYFDGDNGKPWKPCKSMSRVMVAAWGANGKLYAGRSLTLYRDPSVKWGGMEVGGIRISHMTHIDRPMVMALTATKGMRKAFQVQPLKVAASAAPNDAPSASPPVDLDGVLDALRSAAMDGTDALKAAWSDLTRDEQAAAKPHKDALKAAAATADGAAQV